MSANSYLFGPSPKELVVPRPKAMPDAEADAEGGDEVTPTRIGRGDSGRARGLDRAPVVICGRPQTETH